MTAPSNVTKDLLIMQQEAENDRFAREFDTARKAADKILDQIFRKHCRNMLAIYEGRQTDRAPIRITPALALPEDIEPLPPSSVDAVRNGAQAPPAVAPLIFGKPVV